MPMPMPIAAGKSIVYDLWPFPSQIQRRLFYYYVAADCRYLFICICMYVCSTRVYVVSIVSMFIHVECAIITIICLIYDTIL